MPELMDSVQAYDGDGTDHSATGVWSAIDVFEIEQDRRRAADAQFDLIVRGPMPRHVTFEDVRADWAICWQRGVICFLGMRLIDVLAPVWKPPLRMVGRMITAAAVRNVKRMSRP